MHTEPSSKQIQLSVKLKKRLSETQEPTGYIAGWDAEDKLFCTSVSGTTEYFIPGLEVVGFYCLLNGNDNEENDLLNICDQNFGFLKLELENIVVLFVCKDIGDSRNITVLAKSYTPYYRTLLPLPITEIEHNPAVLLRARGQLPLVFEVSSDGDTFKENIELSVERLRVVFQNQVAAFKLQKSRRLLHSLLTPDTEDTCKDLLKIYLDAETTDKLKTKKHAKRKTPLNFEILVQTTGDAALESTFNHSVVIHCQRREFQCASLHLPLDVIVMCQESTSTFEIYQLLTTAIEQQLSKISQCLLIYAKILNVVSPEPYHFYPDGMEFPITVIYPSNKGDEELETYRKELHKQLLLPSDRPFLKKLNACDFSSTSSSGHLFNPHEGINYTGVPGGKIAMVQGRYSYHHYMQDHFNDDGWGCAYRSLQTIISWFKHQGYTDKSVPTHKEIQQALVGSGKQQSFVGSKQWIGSLEVSFCLDYLIKVSSKILSVNSGAELASKGRDLFNHFRDQGTPVMIGGGVLAHTILGVDFNAETGDLKFLILDPHYTGSEDLNIILNKGWCGWKGIQFWDPMAFYNLCMPQRPIQI